MKEKKVGQTKTKEQILDQLYVTAEDLMILIPELKYQRALSYMREIREEMKQKKYFIPATQTRRVLTKLVRKKFGF